MSDKSQENEFIVSNLEDLVEIREPNVRESSDEFTMDTIGSEEVTIEDFLPDDEPEIQEDVEDDGAGIEEGADSLEEEVEIEESEESEEDLYEEDTQPSINYGKMLGDLYGVEALEIDGEVVPIDEAELNQDDFEALVSEYQQKREEEILDGRVALHDLSETAKKLIEIDKAGGDITRAIKTYESFKKPLEQADLNSVKDQIKILKVLHAGQGKSEEESEILIEGYKNKNLLKNKASQAKTLIDDAYSKQMDKLEEDALERQAKEKEILKKYSDDLSIQFKNIGVKDKNFIKKLTNLATNKDAESRIYPIDEVYNQAMQDPELAAEVIFFLTDKTKYLKTKFSDLDRDTKLSYIKKMNLAGNGGSGTTNRTTVQKPNELNKKKKREISLSDLTERL